MLGVYVAIATLTVTILGLLVKLTTFITEIRMWVDEVREERKFVQKIPVLEVRLGYVERQLNLDADNDT